MTLGECLEKTIKLINYYSISGERVSMSDPTILDYTSRAKSAVDTAQKELARRCPLVRRITYTQHTLRPLDSRTGMHYLEGTLALSGLGASAFSFLCDGDISAILERESEGVWQEVLAVARTGNGKLEPVYGELDSPVSAVTKMRLTLDASGAYVASVGLYRSFPQNEEVPVLDTRRFHALPSDFGGVKSVTPSSRFTDAGRKGFYTLEDGKIGFPWAFDGAVEVLYTVYPCTIGEESADTAILGVPDNAAETIPYYVAALLLTDEDPNLSQLFFNLYEDKVAGLEGNMGNYIRNTLFGARRK